MELIICAAVFIKDINRVFMGHRHPQAISAMHDGLSWRYNREQITSMPQVQGFMTSNNRFVGRDEAFKIAKKAKQILDESNTRGSELYSEDLY